MSQHLYTFRILFAFNISAQSAKRTLTLTRTVCAVVGGNAFWEDPVGDLLSYLCKKRPWCEKVVAIAHNAKGFEAHFILSGAILLKWTPKLIFNV